MKKNAFTLIELAIVLIIIGLLVGGVLGGQHLAESSRRSTVVSDLQKYAQAYHDFYEKYHAAPGDYRYEILNNETVESACFSSGSPLNANGVRQITDGERPCAWMQLSQAGFVQGDFLGEDLTQSPKTPYGSTTYVWNYFSTVAANSSGFGYSNALTLGTLRSDLSEADYSFIIPEGAQAIDKKIDDGAPLDGQLFGISGQEGGVSCNVYDVSDLDYYKATNTGTYYKVDNKTKTCYLVYLMNPAQYASPAI